MAARIEQEVDLPSSTPDTSEIEDGHAREPLRAIALRRLPYLGLFIVAFTLSTLAAGAPQTTEHLFSLGVYQMLTGLLAFVTSLVPFSIAEWGIALTMIVVGYKAAQGALAVIRGDHALSRTLAIGVMNVMAAFCLIYFLFIVMWGLNYSRVPLTETAGLGDPASYSFDGSDLIELMEREVAAADALRDELASGDTDGLKATTSIGEVLETAEQGFQRLPPEYLDLLGKDFGRAKGLTSSPALGFFGFMGIYMPFTAEANVNTEIPAALLPFIVCHEQAHQRGIAREGEANFVAYLACLNHPDRHFQYSGRLWAVLYAYRALHKRDTARAEAFIETVPRRVRYDLASLRRWREKNSFDSGLAGSLSRFSRSATKRTNDVFLKANRQSGIASYGRFVDLMLLHEIQYD